MTDWSKKLAAWLHDPAEKALILMRDSVGHEWGTVQALREASALQEAISTRAPTGWPRRPTGPTGRARRERCGRHGPTCASPSARSSSIRSPANGSTSKALRRAGAAVEGVSFDHFAELAAAVGHDPRLAFLAFWRFGPEGALAARSSARCGRCCLPTRARPITPSGRTWTLCPRCTRRSPMVTPRPPGDELWSGAGLHRPGAIHLRSLGWLASALSLVWAGLRVIVAELGPDTVLFPHLRGVPAVDAWLLKEGEAFRKLFQDIKAEFVERKTTLTLCSRLRCPISSFASCRRGVRGSWRRRRSRRRGSGRSPSPRRRPRRSSPRAQHR